MSHRFRTVDPNSPASKARKASYNTREYKAAAKAATLLVRSGQARCWRCHRPIPPDAVRGPQWQVGHDDNDRNIIRGPECARCNRSAAGRKGNRVQRMIRHPRRRTTRDWGGEGTPGRACV